MNQADYPITTMCRLLGVSTSGYYAWVDRGPSTRDEANARLLETINGIHQQSRRTYGAPRITAELREEGHLVGKNRVARLMKVAGIEGVSRRRKTRTTLRGQDSRPGSGSGGAKLPGQPPQPTVGCRHQCAAASGVRDGSRLPATGLQEQVANHRKWLWSKAAVVSVTEKVL